MKNESFVGFAAIGISNGISCKFRLAKIAPTFTAEALAIGEILAIIEKNRLRAKFSYFLGLGKCAKRN
jgi:hypothetical protein